MMCEGVQMLKVPGHTGHLSRTVDMFFVCKIVQIFSEKMHKIQGSMGYRSSSRFAIEVKVLLLIILLTIIIHYSNCAL